MWYLCYFLHRLLDFRLPEVESLAKLFGCFEGQEGLQWKLPPNHHPDSPFYFVNLPSEEIARKIATRSVLVKGIFEIWGEGTSYEELKVAIQSYPEERKLPYLGEESTFKIIVDTFGKVLQYQEQSERIESFSFIPFKGRVSLKNPHHKFWAIETDGATRHNGLPSLDTKVVFFGRELASANRSLVTKFALSNRKYLGPTAMDAEIAHLMVNQSLVHSGKLVYDPFVGTGSILVAAAYHGALTMGADIDIRVIRDGRGPDCNVWSNFKQYDLCAPVGLVRADNNSPPWRSNLTEVFHAIICDPPYGVRAGGRKSGGRKLLKGVRDPYIIPDEKRKEHIPSTAPYTLEECIHDLLDVSARLLVRNGRLVFFFPAARNDYLGLCYPKHPCFTLIAASEQILSTKWSRCLLTMEKTAKYTEELAISAKQKHTEFKENHCSLLEEARERGNLRSLVFAPVDSVEDHLLRNVLGSNKLPGEKYESIAKYRGKYV